MVMLSWVILFRVMLLGGMLFRIIEKVLFRVMSSEGNVI